MLIQAYQEFIEKVRGISFPIIQSQYKQYNTNNWLPSYVPKLHQYSLQIDQHKKEENKLKKVPFFDGKRQYNNDDNLHRRVTGIFKSFILSDYKDLKEYLRLTLDIQQFSNIISRIEVLRFKNSQFNLIYYLFTANRKSIRLFLKLRQEIIKVQTFQLIKYLPISIHNPAKYADKYVYLDRINVSMAKWRQLINIAGFQYDQQTIQILFGQRSEVTAIEVIQLCLFFNKQSSINSSPTK